MDVYAFTQCKCTHIHTNNLTNNQCTWWHYIRVIHSIVTTISVQLDLWKNYVGICQPMLIFEGLCCIHMSIIWDYAFQFEEQSFSFRFINGTRHYEMSLVFEIMTNRTAAVFNFRLRASESTVFNYRAMRNSSQLRYIESLFVVFDRI